VRGAPPPTPLSLLKEELSPKPGTHIMIWTKNGEQVIWQLKNQNLLALLNNSLPLDI